MSEADFDGDPRIQKPDQVVNTADPQNETTVNKAYTTAQKWLRTGHVLQKHQTMVIFQEDDGTKVLLCGILQGFEDSELLARAEDEPLVEIEFIPSESTERETEVYGIGINDETGRKFMEKRVKRDDYITDEILAEKDETAKLAEAKMRMKQDQQIMRGLGQARMTETQTREITDRIAGLAKKHRLSQKADPIKYFRENG